MSERLRDDPTGPLSLDALMDGLRATYGQEVPPTGSYVLVRDIFAAFGREQLYDRLDALARLDTPEGTPAQQDAEPVQPGPRLFRLRRAEDASGVSGIGYVAEGVCFSDGSAVLRWTTQHRSWAVYSSIEELEAIHGHEGRTVIEWQARAEADERLREALERAAPIQWDGRRCRVIHGGHPKGTTCLDIEQHAREQPDRYGADYRSALIAGQHRCSGCIAGAALAQPDSGDGG